MFEMLLASFAVGVLVAIPPGAVTVTASQLALRYGFRRCMVFTMGSALSDLLYLVIVYLGVSRILSESPAYRLLFWFLSGLLLFYFGISAIRSRHSPAERAGPTSGGNLSSFSVFLSGIGITLLNPVTIAAWVAIAGTFFGRWKGSWPDPGTYGPLSLLFIMAGVMGYFVPLMAVVSRLRKSLPAGLLRALIGASGAVLVFFGLWAWYSAAGLALLYM
jgi:threonine/homoserine/homoserine lactone efflux protein